MNISSDILFEILSRIPAVDVINCKLVCKRWVKVSSIREFAKLHLSRENPYPGLVAFQRDDKEFFRIFQFDGDNDPNDLYYDPIIEFDLSVFPELPENRKFYTTPVNSVNGLLCFCHGKHGHEILYVCNPVTREYVTLPIIKGFVQSPDTMVYGFGVSSISGQYKAVRISHSWDPDAIEFGFRPANHKCCVYTLGTGSWRSIVDVPIMYDYHGNLYGDGLFFNGNLHWVIKDLEGIELISCFDLEKESFQPFPSPLPAEQPTSYFLSLGIVTGCLCLCNNASRSDIDIWVMKEYGVKNSWTKDYVISKLPYYDEVLRFDRITLLKIFKDSDILLFTSTNNEFLMTYNNERKTMQMTETIVNIRSQPMLHVSSFLSLKDFEPEEVRMF